MLSVLHHVEDVQVACFAAIFGLMVYQLRKDWTIRFAWYSYLLASVISVIDLGLPQPQGLFVVHSVYVIICTRYALLVAAMVSFTRAPRWPVRISLGVAALSFLQYLLPLVDTPGTVISAFAYFLLAIQLCICGIIIFKSRERSTQLPRYLLGSLFSVSVLFRLMQAGSSLAPPSPMQAWVRDQAVFFNSTIIGCLLPFTIIWLMNTRVQNDLLQQSRIDPLTDLLNRRGLDEAASRELSRYRRGRQDFAIAVVDIDHFKALNDKHGHASGDEVLRESAALFRDVLRQSDIIGRTGGEEFVLLLPMLAQQETLAVLERLRTTLEGRIIWIGEAESVNITVSIGVTHTAGRADISWDVLHEEADRALYAAKHAGRNQTIHFRNMSGNADNSEDISHLPTA